MSRPEKILVGQISAAYGIAGWVRVFSHTDPREQIFSYRPWHLKKGSKSAAIEPKIYKKHNKGLLVLPKAFADRSQAESISGFEIWVDSSQFPSLGRGEYYWHQLEGLDVINAQGQLLGAVSHLMETGVRDVLVLKPSHKSIDNRERLIPYVEPEVIMNINLEAGSINVQWDADY